MMYYIIKLHTVVIAEDLNLNYALYQTSSFKTDSFNILQRILDLNTNEKVWVEHLKGNSVLRVVYIKTSFFLAWCF